LNSDSQTFWLKLCVVCLGSRLRFRQHTLLYRLIYKTNKFHIILCIPVCNTAQFGTWLSLWRWQKHYIPSKGW